MSTLFGVLTTSVTECGVMPCPVNYYTHSFDSEYTIFE